MKGKRYSAEQIFGLLNAHVSGINFADMVRFRDMPAQGSCCGKFMYDGMMSPRLNA